MEWLAEGKIQVIRSQEAALGNGTEGRIRLAPAAGSELLTFVAIDGRALRSEALLAPELGLERTSLSRRG